MQQSGLSGKESAYQCRRCRSDPESGRSPGAGNGNPLQFSCQDNPYGQRSLGGYNLRGHKESDTTEHACTHAVI